MNFSFKTRSGPSTEQIVELDPLRRCSRRTLAGPWRTACAAAASVGRVPRGPRREPSPSSTPSRRTRRASRRPRPRSPAASRNSFGNSSGTTGRSFTTESSTLPRTRRARTTTPCRRGSSRRVEEVDLADLRIEGSMPSAPTAVAVIGVRDRELEALHAVGVLDQPAGALPTPHPRDVARFVLGSSAESR